MNVWDILFEKYPVLLKREHKIIKVEYIGINLWTRPAFLVAIRCQVLYDYIVLL